MLDKYFLTVDKNNIYSSSKRLQFYFDFVFKDLSTFTNKSVLDIGAGKGLFSIYSACKGARRVIALEPEADGSTKDIINHFHQMKAELKVDEVKILPITFQGYYPDDEKFDIIL